MTTFIQSIIELLYYIIDFQATTDLQTFWLLEVPSVLISALIFYKIYKALLYIFHNIKRGFKL